MAASSAAVLSAAARRISRSTAGSGGALLSGTRRISSCSASSIIVTREVTGHHNLTISVSPVEWIASSQAFHAAGYSWRIKYDLNGNSWNESNQCISIIVELTHDKGRQEVEDPIQFKLSLLDRAGNPSPKYICCNDVSFFVDGQARFQDFIRWKDLEESGCLKDDSFIIRCDITVIKKWVIRRSRRRAPRGDRWHRSQGVQGAAPLHVHRRAAAHDGEGTLGRRRNDPGCARGGAPVQAREAQAFVPGGVVPAHRHGHGGRNHGGGGAA
ncbi:hypothetical protein ZEAMMB73_Zm00001d000139 [Zea mays]|jgi:hypothetical protein|uniref:MATH domain-containing protein n=1 Tax=Zea mays TaxID=4577 RepID=A0A804LQD8_MAIZE|nr:hypothetical protein ZEAMMB73_Zm00001d000139 [Zea mays]